MIRFALIVASTLGFVLTAALGNLMTPLLRAFRVQQEENEPPTMGGLCLMVGVLAAVGVGWTAACVAQPELLGAESLFSVRLLTALLGALLFGGVGLLEDLARIRSGLIEDGTAIGNGLATAINRLRESDAKSKVIILLTDGVNNQGQIAPMTAAEIAKAQGIRVYTIGVGTEGMAPYPAIDMFGNLTFVNQKVEIDEKVLKAISDMTGGRYFRATDKEKLKAVYDEINQLEKSKIEVMEHISYHELFLTWALAALGLLFAEFLLSNLVLKRIP